MSLLERGKNMIAELKRRKVFHVGSLYLIAAWGGSLGAAELFPAFGIPDWAVRAFVLIAMLGFPLALVLAWAFEITPDGVVRDSGEGSEAGPRAAAAADENATWGTTTRWAGNSSSSVAVDIAGRDNSTRQFHEDFVIGRDATAGFQVPESKISRRHARIYYQDNAWYIQDLGSRNGTILNGLKIAEPTLLQISNEVRFYDGGPTLNVRVNTTDVETQLA